MSEVMVSIGMDGQPSAQMRRILAEDVSEEGYLFYPTSLICSFGGLHTIMKTLNAEGGYFTEPLKELTGAY